MKNKSIGEYGIYITLIALFVLFSILNANFLTSSNMINLLRQISINGLIAIGMTMVITSDGIDLSVGATLGLTGMITAMLITSGLSPFLVIIIALLIGTILGAINGVLISKFKLQAFIVTLATMTIYRGITYVLSDGKPISNISSDSIFSVIGKGEIGFLPVPVLIFILIFLIGYFVMNKTVFGRNIYATGGNQIATKLAGIDTDLVKIKVYAISGFLATLAGLILISRLNSAQPTLGSGYELDAIAAVAIGGTSLAGGRGRITGTLIGILILGIISNGLNIMGISSFYQEIIKGFIILVAVLIDRKQNK